MTKKTSTVLKATNFAIMNAVFDETGSFGERIPQLTQDNWVAVGNAIQDYEPAKNSFIDTLINKIARTLIFAGTTQNKLARFNSGRIDLALDIEEMWVDFAKASVFNPATAETEYAKRVFPKVDVVYHRMNTQLMYKRTVTRAQLKSAFTTEGGLADLSNKIIEGCIKGATHDEYLLTKAIFKQYEGKYFQVKVDAITNEATALDFYEKVLAITSSLDYVENSDKYRYAGNLDRVGAERLVLIISKEISPLVKVKVLSKLFNKDQLDLPSEIVEVDNFGGLTDTVALLVDERWFRIYNNLAISTTWFNPQGLYHNFWYHNWATYSQSPFFAAIQFTTGELLTEEQAQMLINKNEKLIDGGLDIVKTLNLVGEDSELSEGNSKADIKALAEDSAKLLNK